MLFHFHIFVFVLSLCGIACFSSSPCVLTYSSRAIFISLYEDFPGTSNSLEFFSRLNSLPIIFCAPSFTLTSLTRTYELFLFPVLDFYRGGICILLIFMALYIRLGTKYIFLEVNEY